MKTLTTIFGMVLFTISVNAQRPPIDVNILDADLVVEVKASCGQCNFGMKDAKGCDLAVKIDDKYYWVDGTSIHDHGDAHAEGGFCASIRDVETIGEVINGRFHVSYFKVLPLEEKGHEGHKHN